MRYKYALVEGVRREAEPGLSGLCQGCGSPMIAKCGELRIWHWAHRGERSCDSWWESETPWHRDWKGAFPSDWQEVRQQAEDGEWHIADLKTPHGAVVEFQHSPITPEERRAREAFYPQMCWVVDGTRRKRDRATFERALRAPQILQGRPLLMRLSAQECSLLRDWDTSTATVFLDFGEENVVLPSCSFREPMLWQLLPGILAGSSFVRVALKSQFIECVRAGTIVLERSEVAPVRPKLPLSRPPYRSTGFERFMARQRPRRRF